MMRSLFLVHAACKKSGKLEIHSVPIMVQHWLLPWYGGTADEMRQVLAHGSCADTTRVCKKRKLNLQDSVQYAQTVQSPVRIIFNSVAGIWDLLSRGSLVRFWAKKTMPSSGTVFVPKNGPLNDYIRTMSNNNGKLLTKKSSIIISSGMKIGPLREKINMNSLY